MHGRVRGSDGFRRLAKARSKDPLDSFAESYNRALISALSAMYEVIVGAPVTIGDLASEAFRSLMDLRSGVEDSDAKCVSAQVDLLAAMRQDLGEPLRLIPPL